MVRNQAKPRATRLPSSTTTRAPAVAKSAASKTAGAAKTKRKPAHAAASTKVHKSCFSYCMHLTQSHMHHTTDTHARAKDYGMRSTGQSPCTQSNH